MARRARVRAAAGARGERSRRIADGSGTRAARRRRAVRRRSLPLRCRHRPHRRAGAHSGSTVSRRASVGTSGRCQPSRCPPAIAESGSGAATAAATGGKGHHATGRPPPAAPAAATASPCGPGATRRGPAHGCTQGLSADRRAQRLGGAGAGGDASRGDGRLGRRAAAAWSGLRRPRSDATIVAVRRASPVPSGRAHLAVPVEYRLVPVVRPLKTAHVGFCYTRHDASPRGPRGWPSLSACGPFRALADVKILVGAAVLVVPLSGGFWYRSMQAKSARRQRRGFRRRLRRMVRRSVRERDAEQQTRGHPAHLSSITGSDALHSVRIYDRRSTRLRLRIAAESAAPRPVRRGSCLGCHDDPLRPRETLHENERHTVSRRDGDRLLSYVEPIYNKPECSTAACHAHDGGVGVYGYCSPNSR